MSDETKLVLSQLELHVEDMPLERIIDELLVVNERLNFAGVNQALDAYSEEQRKQIDFLLSRDVSAGMLQFVLYLAAQHALHYVMDDISDVFIDYCRTYFSDRTQIQVVTAVAVSEEIRQRVKVMLKQLHPEDSRILFTTDRSLIAGFVIQVNDRRPEDLSFKAQVVNLIEERVNTKQKEFYGSAN